MMKISSIFVAFLENTNFKGIYNNITIFWSYLAYKLNLGSLFYEIDDGPLKWWNRWNSDIHLLVLSLKSRVGVFSNLLSSAIKPPNNIKLLLSVFLSVWLPKIYNPFLAWQKSQCGIFCKKYLLKKVQIW